MSSAMDGVTTTGLLTRVAACSLALGLAALVGSAGHVVRASGAGAQEAHPHMVGRPVAPAEMPQPWHDEEATVELTVPPDVELNLVADRIAMLAGDPSRRAILEGTITITAHDRPGRLIAGGKSEQLFQIHVRQSRVAVVEEGQGVRRLLIAPLPAAPAGK